MRKRLHADRAVLLWRVLFGEQYPLLSSYSSFVLSERPGETGINHDEWQMSFLLFQLHSRFPDSSSLRHEISTLLSFSLTHIPGYWPPLILRFLQSLSLVCSLKHTTYQPPFPSSHRRECARSRNRRSATHPQSTHHALLSFSVPPWRRDVCCYASRFCSTQ